MFEIGGRRALSAFSTQLSATDFAPVSVETSLQDAKKSRIKNLSFKRLG
jgi:hypothetical protein